jgi:hypothetical protein
MITGKIKGKWNVLIPCVNQDTGKSLRKGHVITELSASELGRLMAFSYIEDAEKKEKEQNDKIRKKTRAKRQRVL